MTVLLIYPVWPLESHNEWYHYYCSNFYLFNISSRQNIQMLLRLCNIWSTNLNVKCESYTGRWLTWHVKPHVLQSQDVRQDITIFVIYCMSDWYLKGLMFNRSYSKCSNISNTSCLPKRPRQTVQTQIRLLLKKLSQKFGNDLKIRTWPVFYDALPFCKTWMKLLHPLKSYQLETKSVTMQTPTWSLCVDHASQATQKRNRAEKNT